MVERTGNLSTLGLERNRKFIAQIQPAGTDYVNTLTRTDPRLANYQTEDGYVIVEQGADRNDGYERDYLVTVFKKQL
jgi:hypothetical protein